jgi:hypothetical protein
LREDDETTDACFPPTDRADHVTVDDFDTP